MILLVEHDDMGLNGGANQSFEFAKFDITLIEKYFLSLEKEDAQPRSSSFPPCLAYRA